MTLSAQNLFIAVVQIELLGSNLAKFYQLVILVHWHHKHYIFEKNYLLKIYLCETSHVLDGLLTPCNLNVIGQFLVTYLVEQHFDPVYNEFISSPRSI